MMLFTLILYFRCFCSAPDELGPRELESFLQLCKGMVLLPPPSSSMFVLVNELVKLKVGLGVCVY